MNRTIAIVCLFTTACLAKHQITGQILDRNGKPLPRAVVSLTPGNVSMVTDTQGNFVIDYLRDEGGDRTRLSTRTEYTFEVAKVGFHTFKQPLVYKRGSFMVEPVMMIEHTIDITDLPENLDPGLYTSPTQSAGATYEGQ